MALKLSSSTNSKEQNTSFLQQTKKQLSILYYQSKRKIETWSNYKDRFNTKEQQLLIKKGIPLNIATKYDKSFSVKDIILLYEWAYRKNEDKFFKYQDIGKNLRWEKTNYRFRKIDYEEANVYITYFREKNLPLPTAEDIIIYVNKKITTSLVEKFYKIAKKYDISFSSTDIDNILSTGIGPDYVKQVYRLCIQNPTDPIEIARIFSQDELSQIKLKERQPENDNILHEIAILVEKDPKKYKMKNIISKINKLTKRFSWFQIFELLSMINSNRGIPSTEWERIINDFSSHTINQLLEYPEEKKFNIDNITELYKNGISGNLAGSYPKRCSIKEIIRLNQKNILPWNSIFEEKKKKEIMEIIKKDKDTEYSKNIQRRINLENIKENLSSRNSDKSYIWNSTTNIEMQEILNSKNELYEVDPIIPWLNFRRGLREINPVNALYTTNKQSNKYQAQYIHIQESAKTHTLTSYKELSANIEEQLLIPIWYWVSNIQILKNGSRTNVNLWQNSEVKLLCTEDGIYSIILPQKTKIKIEISNTSSFNQEPTDLDKQKLIETNFQLPDTKIFKNFESEINSAKTTAEKAHIIQTFISTKLMKYWFNNEADKAYKQNIFWNVTTQQYFENMLSYYKDKKEIIWVCNQADIIWIILLRHYGIPARSAIWFMGDKKTIKWGWHAWTEFRNWTTREQLDCVPGDISKDNKYRWKTEKTSTKEISNNQQASQDNNNQKGNEEPKNRQHTSITKTIEKQSIADHIEACKKAKELIIDVATSTLQETEWNKVNKINQLYAGYSNQVDKNINIKFWFKNNLDSLLQNKENSSQTNKQEINELLSFDKKVKTRLLQIKTNDSALLYATKVLKEKLTKKLKASSSQHFSELPKFIVPNNNRLTAESIKKIWLRSTSINKPDFKTRKASEYDIKNPQMEQRIYDYIEEQFKKYEISMEE